MLRRAHKNLLLKVSNYLKVSSASFSRAQSASFLILTLNSFQEVLKVSSFSGHDLIFVDVDGSCQFPVGRAPSGS